MRYPGGKSAFYELIVAILGANGLGRRQYAEPFAGGCGLALTLLYENAVSDIHVNDVDRGVVCFWRSALQHSADLVALIRSTPLTVEEWEAQREVYRDQDDGDPVSLGFVTFFLNRTNRSGIVKGAGVIGGLAQRGNYKIGCRFNRDDLVERVRRVAKYRDRIHLSGLDALDFIRKLDGEERKTFLFVEPPYFAKGSSLYTNYYASEDHRRLATALLGIKQPWVLTYDDVREIRKLYGTRRQYAVRVQYSVQTKRSGSELLVPSKGLRIPSSAGLERVRRAVRAGPSRMEGKREELKRRSEALEAAGRATGPYAE